MCTIEKNGKSKLKQKLSTPASWDNGSKTGIVVLLKSNLWIFHELLSQYGR